MSQQDNFGSGFFLGTLFGGIVGGVIGVVVATRVTARDRRGSDEESLNGSEPEGMLAASEEEMEIARRGLEDKIAQLNTAIDDVRQRLNSPNGYPQSAAEERSMHHDG